MGAGMRSWWPWRRLRVGQKVRLTGDILACFKQDDVGEVIRVKTSPREVLVFFRRGDLEEYHWLQESQVVAS